VTLNLTLTKIITIYFAGGLAWYVYDAAQVIATKIAKKPFDGIDRDKSAYNYVAKAGRMRCAKY
jgi:hypothetical protein